MADTKQGRVSREHTKSRRQTAREIELALAGADEPLDFELLYEDEELEL
jgi:hypothetical protein